LPLIGAATPAGAGGCVGAGGEVGAGADVGSAVGAVVAVGSAVGEGSGVAAGSGVALGSAAAAAGDAAVSTVAAGAASVGVAALSLEPPEQATARAAVNATKLKMKRISCLYYVRPVVATAAGPFPESVASGYQSCLLANAAPSDSAFSFAQPTSG
jgi:hypothetical protein